MDDEAEVRVVVDGDETTLALDPVAVQRNKLRVDARKWVLSKLAPKKYGDKLELSGDKNAPLALVVSGSDVHG